MKKQYQVYINYKSSENILDKETCESIIIKGDNKNTCIFTEGINGAKGTCLSHDYNIWSIVKENFDLTSSLSTIKKEARIKNYFEALLDYVRKFISQMTIRTMK